MKLTLANHCDHPIPVTSTDDGGWAVQLEPGVPQTIDKPGSGVWIVGDKPGAAESIAKGLQHVIDLINVFRKDKAARSDELGTLFVDVVNPSDSPFSVRIIPASVDEQRDLPPGQTVAHVTSHAYIELRELSGAPPPGY